MSDNWTVIKDAGSRSLLLATPGIPKDLTAVPDLIVAGRITEDGAVLWLNAPDGEEWEFLVRDGVASEIELREAL